MTDQTRTVARDHPAAGVRPAPVPTALGPVALATLLLGSFLPMFSFFVINVALPAIGSDLQSSAAELQLVVGGYGITSATLLVVGGRLGDGFGRRRLFLAGMLGFTATSLLCAIAPTMSALLAARAVQGVAAALMTPQVLATISGTLEGAARARAVAMFGVAGGASAAAGQILGGVLVDADVAGTGWRSIFLLNAALGAAALGVARRVLPETRSAHRLPIDLAGAGMLAVTLVLLLLPLTEGRPLGWPLWTWVLLAAAVPSALVLAAHQRRAERAGRIPLVPPSLLGLSRMRIGLVLVVAFFTTFSGFMFTFALATQGEAGMSPLEGGLSLLPMALGFLASSIIGPRLQERLGAGVIVLGGAVQAVGYGALAATTIVGWPAVSPSTLAVPMVVTGVGSGLVMLPMIGVVLRQVPMQQAGLGSGLLMTAQQTCLALGAATIGTAYLSAAESGWGQGGALAAVEITTAAVSVLICLIGLRLRGERT